MLSSPRPLSPPATGPSTTCRAPSQPPRCDTSPEGKQSTAAAGFTSIIGTGFTLAAPKVGRFAWLRSDMRSGLEPDNDRLLAVDKELTRTIGLLKGLGLTGPATPTTEPS